MSLPEVPEQQDCPLCAADASALVETRHGMYFRCPDCDLVSRWAQQWLEERAEREYYGTHENDPADPGYRSFLSRLTEPLFERLPKGAKGLDFGCGPAPTVSVLAEEAGFSMVNFDPLFQDRPELLQAGYDFVTCTEAVEHFHRPLQEFSTITGLIRPGGWLGLMTELHDAGTDFSTWWYLRDPTHVIFYSAATLDWLASRFGWRTVFRNRAVTIFQRISSRGQKSTTRVFGR